MIMITVTILALVVVFKSFCNTVCIYMVMQIKLVVVVVVTHIPSPLGREHFKTDVFCLIFKAFRVFLRHAVSRSNEGNLSASMSLR